MAPSPLPRRTAALLLSLLLLFSVAAHAALQEGQDKEVVDGRAEAMTGFAAAEEDDPCGGAAAGEGGEAEREECLMRRTLAAHTDYIYTQGGGHN